MDLRPHLVWIPLTLLLVSVALPAGAQEISVAVAPFSGRRSGQVRTRVGRSLRDDAALVSRRRTDRAARRHRLSGTRRRGVADFADDLRVQVVVQGSVTGRRRRARVRLVFRRSDGSELTRMNATFPRTAAQRRTFTRRLLDTWREVRDEVGDGEDARDDYEEPDEEVELPPDEEMDSERPPTFDDDDDDDRGSSAGVSDGLALVAATVGIAARNRDATINLADGGRRAYGSGIYPELQFALEVRPLALQEDLARGLFLYADFAHSLGLSSQTEAGAQVDTNFMRLAVGGGFLFGVVQDVEIGLGLYMGYDGLFLSPNDTMPSAEYLHIRPALRGRFRLMQEAVVLEFNAGYRGVLGVGAFGTTFGNQAGAHGVDLTAAIGGNLFTVAEVGFTWGVALTWVGYFLSFAGEAEMPGNLASDGFESAFRAGVVLGWSFR